MVFHLWNGIISDTRFENNLKAYPDLQERAAKYGLTLLVENVICRKEIAQAQDPAAKRTELAAAYTEKFSNPYFAAGKGYIDAVIRPGETRAEIIIALALLEDKPHPGHRGNMPL